MNAEDYMPAKPHVAEVSEAAIQGNSAGPTQ